MFPPDLRQTTKAHLEAMIAAGVAEHQSLEFKRSLPNKDGAIDPWMTGGAVGNAAKNKLAEAVCALANGDGGHLLLGMDETESNPSRAHALVPLPRIGDLAERLRQHALEVIEPPLSHLEVVPVPTDSDDTGVIVYHVLSSARAPHRVRTTGKVMIRRGPASRELTMREIQDLTLQRAGSIEQRLSRLERGADTFAQRVQPGQIRVRPRVGIRVAAMPFAALTIPDLVTEAVGFPYFRRLHATFDNAGPSRELPLPLDELEYRPIMRGMELRRREADVDIIAQATQDGVVEYTYLESNPRSHSDAPTLSPDWLIGLLANALFTVQHLRLVAAAPSAEYAVEIQIVSSRQPIGLRTFSWISQGPATRMHIPENLRFYTFTLGPISELDAMATRVATDVFNAAGEYWSWPLRITIPPDIAQFWREGPIIRPEPSPLPETG